MEVKRKFHAITIFIPKYSPQSLLDNKMLGPTTGLYEVVKGIFLPRLYLIIALPAIHPASYSTVLTITFKN
jgi:hypothetical protein